MGSPVGRWSLDRRDALLTVEAAPDGSVWFSDVRGIYRLV
jgi:hypothetical protein